MHGTGNSHAPGWTYLIAWATLAVIIVLLLFATGFAQVIVITAAIVGALGLYLYFVARRKPPQGGGFVE